MLSWKSGRSLKEMDERQRQAWYREQKSNRQREQNGTRRSFASAAGYVTEESPTNQSLTEQLLFEV